MTSIERTTFFSYARRAPFGGSLTQQQVDGMNDILSFWNEKYRDFDIRWLAYYMATVFHETSARMVPVREGSNAKRMATDAQAVAAAKYVYQKGYTRIRYFDVGRYGYVPYGRGRVQVTLDDNYAFVAKKTGADPRALDKKLLESRFDLEVSMRGTFEGWWTRGRHKMIDYFSDHTDDPEGARRIVNGTDKAKLIAGYYRNFLGALEAAHAARSGNLPKDVTSEDAEPDDKRVVESKPVLAALGSFVTGGGGLTLMGALNNPYALAAFAMVLVAGAIGLWLVLTGRVSIKRG